MNKYIAVSYDLFINGDADNEPIEQTTSDRPFQFVSGLGFTFEAFENQILPLKKGDRFDFVVPKDQAHGERDEDYVFDVPKSIFCIDGKFDDEEIYPGNIVPLMDAEGNRMQGLVVAVKKDKVTLDLNNPLAGKDLRFVGEVLEIRDATDEEVAGMKKLMSGEGCGCHCDSCDHKCHGENDECDGEGCDGCGHCK